MTVSGLSQSSMLAVGFGDFQPWRTRCDVVLAAALITGLSRQTHCPHLYVLRRF